MREIIENVKEEAIRNQNERDLEEVVEELDSEWEKEVLENIEKYEKNELTEALLALDLESKAKQEKKDKVIASKKKLKMKIKNNKAAKLIEAAKSSKKITSFFTAKLKLRQAVVDDDTDRVEAEADIEHVKVKDVDQLTWQLRDKLEQAMTQAMRLRRAAIQKRKAMEIMAKKRKTRKELTTILTSVLMGEWQ